MNRPVHMPKPVLITLADVDQRSRAARNARRLAADLARDLGAPTSAQQTLIDRASFMAVLLEDGEARWLSTGQIDVQAHGVLVGHLRRCIEALGLHERSDTDATPAGIALIRRAAGKSAA